MVALFLLVALQHSLQQLWRLSAQASRELQEGAQGGLVCCGLHPNDEQGLDPAAVRELLLSDFLLDASRSDLGGQSLEQCGITNAGHAANVTVSIKFDTIKLDGKSRGCIHLRKNNAGAPPAFPDWRDASRALPRRAGSRAAARGGQYPGSVQVRLARLLRSTNLSGLHELPHGSGGVRLAVPLGKGVQ